MSQHLAVESWLRLGRWSEGRWPLAEKTSKKNTLNVMLTRDWVHKKATFINIIYI